MEKSQNKRSTYLITGTICLLFIGVIYAWSILKQPLCQEFNWTVRQEAANYTVTIWFFVAGIYLSGFISRRCSRTRIACAGIAVTGCAYILTSLFLKGNILFLYVFYGALSGLGTGLAYSALVAFITSCYPERKGLSSGILMTGFGASTLVLGSLVSALLKRGIGWRTAFLGLGTALLLLSIVELLVFRGSSERRDTDKMEVMENNEETDRDAPSKVMLRKASFWRFFIYCTFLSAVGSFVISFGRELFLSSGTSETLAVTLVGCLSVCNGLGRLLCGTLCDRIGVRKAMLTSCVIVLFSVAALFAAICGRISLCAIIGACLVGLSYGFCPTVTSVFSREKFGNKYFGTNYSIASSTLLPASLTVTLIGTLLQKTNSFPVCLAVLFVFSCIAFVCSLIPEKK